MIRITVDLDIEDNDLLGLKEQLAMALENVQGVKRVFIPKIIVQQQSLRENAERVRRK